ncbi:hypothetical protein LEN26_000874 [Aphanomyces euteiches]|nr:hypothetical protein AeMF1_011739 [Aphanomyces euteiches]KAH9162617.1 hypothetical protein LEN26_000874 [Aphanomyces euteiches]
MCISTRPHPWTCRDEFTADGGQPTLWHPFFKSQHPRQSYLLTAFMGLLGAKREAQLKAGIEQWLLKKTDDNSSCAEYEHELKRIKEILKTHDTQHHLLPLAFHKHIKPPVKPPTRLLVKPEIVAGKRVPFTKTVAKKHLSLMDVIYESDDAAVVIFQDKPSKMNKVNMAQRLLLV